MANYAKGANAERELMVFLRREKRRLAYRTAGSHSPIDVISPRSGDETWGIQLKSGRRRWPSRDERAALLIECAMAGWQPWIVFREPRKDFEFVHPDDWPPT